MKFLNNQKSSIPNLQVNDKSVTSDVDKANVLNKHFYDNFNQSTPLLPPYSTHLNSHEFPDELLCTEDYLYELITNLDVTKSSGVDGISARMLKQTSASIVPSLTKLFNLSLRTRTFPDDWKHARVVPIPKCGDLSFPTNYRPISILPVVSKLLEQHMYKLIHEHMSVH